MLQITPQMKILVAVEPADFRRGIDGLARLCRETLHHDPFVGAVFVFRNRKGTALKVLMYDGQGFWLCHKKLETENSPIPGFTEVRRRAHNQQAGIPQAGRMVGVSRKSGPRRIVMRRQGSPSVPPRALQKREQFPSINSGHS
jgi:transposase